MSTKARPWPLIQRSSLNRSIAGAGPLGTVLALLSLILGLLFLMMESHFLMMASLSMMLLFYTAGSQLNIVVVDSLKLMFSSRHIDEKSSQIIGFTEELRRAVNEKVGGGSFDFPAFRFVGQNELTQCTEIFVAGEKPGLKLEDFLNYLRTHFYSDAHEHYQYNATCLDLVGNLTPLFGIAGTLYGMLPVLTAMREGSDITMVSGGMGIAMNATLYGAVFSVFFKVLASRFKQQIMALNYHFDEVDSQLRFLVGHAGKPGEN
ncbi:MotA/TolQ/ExbB proton channel family protein [Bdellovibrionota bacterium FG-2]